MSFLLHAPKGFVLSAALATALTAAVAASASAQSFDERITPAVLPQHFARFKAELGLSAGDRRVSDLTFSQYFDEVRQLADAAEAEAEAAGKSRVEAMIRGRGHMSAEQLSRTELAVLEAYAEIWPQLDQLFERLSGDLQLMIVGPAAADMQQATQRLRREIALHPLQSSGEVFKGYLGEGVDLIQLAQRAANEGVLPQWKAALSPAEEAAASLPPGGRELGELLASYAQQLDALLRQSAPAQREEALLRKRAEVAGDRAALARIDEAAVQRWHRHYLFTRQMAEAIGQLVGAVQGANAQKAWHAMVGRAIAPWLFGIEPADRAAAWIAENAEAQLKDQAKSIFDAFVEARDAARKNLLSAVVESRLRTKAMLRPQGGSLTETNAALRRAQQELDQHVYSLITLEAEARASLAGLLSDSQRRAMQREIDARR